jgi:hypothetical protein
VLGDADMREYLVGYTVNPDMDELAARGDLLASRLLSCLSINDLSQVGLRLAEEEKTGSIPDL